MHNKAINILLVDDDKIYISIFKFWLDAQGHNTSAVYNGTDAISFIKNTPTDIVFLDINMPGINGIETLQQIKAYNKSLPVIMVTAAASKEQYSEALTLGITGFFPKTDDFTKAAELIKKALSES